VTCGVPAPECLTASGTVRMCAGCPESMLGGCKAIARRVSSDGSSHPAGEDSDSNAEGSTAVETVEPSGSYAPQA
jgi:hypothetical protein